MAIAGAVLDITHNEQGVCRYPQRLRRTCGLLAAASRRGKTPASR